MAHPRRALVVSLVLLSAAACTAREEGEAAGREAPAAREIEGAPTAPEGATAEAEGARAAVEGAPATPDAPAEAPARAGSEIAPAGSADPSAAVPPTADDEALARAARRALEQASRVAPGQNDCETAYARLEALVASMAREAPGSVRDLPPADRFLGVCSSLPPAMQRCLVVEYAIDHEEECSREHEALDPALRATLDAVIRGDG